MNSINSIIESEETLKFRKVIKFVIPTYLTSLFTTLYTIVDGVFVSKFVGTDALAAVNIVYPIINILLGIAYIFAIGGSALAAISIGQKKYNEANIKFTTAFISSIVIGGIITLLFFIFLDKLLYLLGATDKTIIYCKDYIIPWMVGFILVIGKEIFTYFIRIDGSPLYSFIVSLAGGITNIILDYVFIVPMKMGIYGAALATIIGIAVSFVIGLYYIVFMSKTVKFKYSGISFSFIPRCLINGSSEFINQIAIAITTIAFNISALKFAGEDGIAAVTITMYLQFIFIGLAFGYSMGVSPLLGHAFGEGKKNVCRKIEKYSFRFLGIVPGILYIIGFFVAPYAVSFFAEKTSDVYNLAVYGMRIYSIGFIVFGISIFSAVRLTSYAYGHLSAIITFLRSFFLLLLFLYILPIFWEMNGVWAAVPCAEIITVFVSILFTYKTKYLSEN